MKTEYLVTTENSKGEERTFKLISSANVSEAQKDATREAYERGFNDREVSIEWMGYAIESSNFQDKTLMYDNFQDFLETAPVGHKGFFNEKWYYKIYDEEENEFYTVTKNDQGHYVYA